MRCLRAERAKALRPAADDLPRREPVYKRVNTAATLRDDPTLVTEIALAAWKPTGWG
jgi:hypothetical protein